MRYLIYELLWTCCFYIFVTYIFIYTKQHDFNKVSEILNLMLLVSAAYQSYQFIKINRKLSKKNHEKED